MCDLSVLPLKDRCDHWRRVIGDKYFDLDIKMKSNADLGGKLVYSKAGAVTLGAFQSVPQTHERTRALLRDERDSFIAVMQLQGRLHLSHAGRDHSLGPGDLVLMDTAEPYYADFIDEYQIFVVTIPRLLLTPAHKIDTAINRPLDKKRGATLISEYFRDIGRQFNYLSSEQLACSSKFGIDLLLNTIASSNE